MKMGKEKLRKENTYRKEQESKQMAKMYNWKQMFCQKPGAWLQAELTMPAHNRWEERDTVNETNTTVWSKNKDWNTHWSSHIPFLLGPLFVFSGCLFYLLSHEFSEKEGKKTKRLQGVKLNKTIHQPKTQNFP